MYVKNSFASHGVVIITECYSPVITNVFYSFVLNLCFLHSLYKVLYFRLETTFANLLLATVVHNDKPLHRYLLLVCGVRYVIHPDGRPFLANDQRLFVSTNETYPPTNLKPYVASYCVGDSGGLSEAVESPAPCDHCSALVTRSCYLPSLW